MFFRHAIAPLALLLLAGCQTAPQPQAGSLDAGFGEAVKYDMAIQTIELARRRQRGLVGGVLEFGVEAGHARIIERHSAYGDQREQ